MTYDELWHSITQSKRLYDITRDPLLKSGISLLTKAMQRDDPDAPDHDIELTELEEYAVNNLQSCVEAYETLYFKTP